MRARGDPPVCPEQWPIVGHRPALLPATRKGRFGSTAVHPVACGNRPQWVVSGHSFPADGSKYRRVLQRRISHCSSGQASSIQLRGYVL